MRFGGLIGSKPPEFCRAASDLSVLGLYAESISGSTYALAAANGSRRRAILFASLLECMDQRSFYAGSSQLMSSHSHSRCYQRRVVVGLGSIYGSRPVRPDGPDCRRALGRRGMPAFEDGTSTAHCGPLDGRCRAIRTARPTALGDVGRVAPTPVVVIAERYRIDQATTLYRMGVSEYISRKHHLDQLPEVLGAYLRQ